MDATPSTTTPSTTTAPPAPEEAEAPQLLPLLDEELAALRAETTDPDVFAVMEAEMRRLQGKVGHYEPIIESLWELERVYNQEAQGTSSSDVSQPEEVDAVLDSIFTALDNCPDPEALLIALKKGEITEEEMTSMLAEVEEGSY